MKDGLRCLNCNKKFGEALEGRYEGQCPRCRWGIIVEVLNGELVHWERLQPVLR